MQSMFNRIAANYDRLNRVMSLRQDVKWRKAVAGFVLDEKKSLGPLRTLGRVKIRANDAALCGTAFNFGGPVNRAYL